MKTVGRWITSIVLLALVFAAGVNGVSAQPDGQRPGRVDLHLWTEAQKAPGQKIPVIIQMTSGDQDGKALIQKHGGRTIDQFPLIGGFRVELPAAAVERLGRDQSVKYINLDAPLLLQSYDTAALSTVYNQVINAPTAWNEYSMTGKGIGIAVLDTGVNQHDDIKDHLMVIKSNTKALHGNDANGHGTHVAGIIAGRSSSGQYMGVAPEAQIIGVKIADDQGMSSEGDLLRGLQWVYDNRARYNIRIVNLSISGSVEISYLNSAIDAAVEQLWRAGVVVVVASGNRGGDPNAVKFPPSNDPFVITVGALDDNGTVSGLDDSLAFFSGVGVTQDGFGKPEIIAPGRKIVSLLAGNNVTLAQRFPERVTGRYIRLSGTSMASPVVAGAAALLLQRYPSLTPDQVKTVLVGSARPYGGQPSGTAPLLDVKAALALAGAGPVAPANQGLTWNTTIDPATGAVNWSNAYWENAYWESAYTENADYMFSDFD
ncbi:MAG TPA: S8 family peptidase [Symbiobacteriaceae bacterium]|nr:S8 family peptidase [Symbiobacteriaceae bacterium]